MEIENNVKGLVFSKNEIDIYKILNTVNITLEKFLHEKLNIPLSYNDFEKISTPDIRYISGNGLDGFNGGFHAYFSFPSELSFNKFSSPTISIFEFKNIENIQHYRKLIACSNINEFNDHHYGFELSLYCSEDSPDIIQSILKHFGDDYIAYLIRNDDQKITDFNFDNIVKIGKFQSDLSNNFISEESYNKIRNEEIENLKTYIN